MKVKIHHDQDPQPTPEPSPDEHENSLGIQRRIPGKELALGVERAD